MNKELWCGERGREGEAPRGDAGDSSEEAVAQAEGQGAEADGDEHKQAVVAQDLAEGDEAAVGADEALDVGAEDGAARDEGGGGADDGGGGDDGPAAGEAEDEAGEGHGGAVADERRERGGRGQQEEQDPAARELAPAGGDGAQGGEDAVREDEEHDAQRQQGGADDAGEHALQGRQAVAELEQLVRGRDAALHEALPEGALVVLAAGAVARVGCREAPRAGETGAAEEIAAAVGALAGPWGEWVGVVGEVVR